VADHAQSSVAHNTIPRNELSGNISVQNDSGQADLSIPVQGSAHKGTIHVVAKKSEGEWTYNKLTLEVDDSPKRVDLLQPSHPSNEEK